MNTKLDEMWAALEAHKPKRGYAKAWRVMLKERTEYAAWSAAWAADTAAWAANAAETAAWAANAARKADHYAQFAIDAIKKVKP
jgi:hypothetical protein